MKKLSKALSVVLGMVLGLGFFSCQTGTTLPDPTMYTVSISSSIEHGKVTADKSSAEAGATVKLTATADSGYELESYSVKDASANAITVTDGTFTMPKSNVTVSATFKETVATPQKTAMYTVSISSSIEHGKVTADKSSAEAGATVKLTATADSGYELESYSVKDASANTITVTEGTFTMPKSNVTVSATFKATAVTPQKTAGSISYATTTVEKTTYDEAFTNELTKTGDGTVTYASSKTDVATVNASTGEVTIVGAGTATITATVADSDTYTYATKTASYIIKVINIIGTKAPGVGKDVGDIVFTDGSAMPYADFAALDDDAKNEKKSFAIALIFYKGTGLNSGNDTTTSRTLGVGLKHNRNGTWWCMNGAAYNINITTVQCKASGSDGALTFTDETANDRNGSDNFEQIAAFLTSTDGVTDDTVTKENSYGAFQSAKNYKNKATNITGTAYEDGWYIPSLAELFQIYANGKGANKVFDIDSASLALGGTQFENALYWSSSQSVSEDNKACTIRFMDGKVMEIDKKDYCRYVCYIREFN